ncbi:MAG TPA: xanthine dehydrogenase family protein subunit M [Candidatus Binataceae bacterium]|nr:xanthine dehydrogenase family protein subunit M [Candidatus Binataceae bacterium]
MYPKAIESYFAPTTVDEALKLLTEHRNGAKLLAGGQSLMPMIKFRLVEPGCLIDLNRIPALATIGEADGALCVGAMVRHADVATHPLVAASYPLLADAARLIGDLQIRNRGTIGGSLAHADPSADYPVAMLALEARMVLSRAGGGRRVVEADKFFVGPLTSVLDADELLTEIQLPKPAARAGGAYVKHSLVAGDFALVSVGVQLTLRTDGRCERATIAIGGLPARAAYARQAAKLLAGTVLDDAICARAGQTAAGEVEVGTDVRASEAYRRGLIASYVPAMIKQARERAGAAAAAKK